MEALTRAGTNVRALYSDDDNPVTWFDTVVVRAIRADKESGEELRRVRLVVNFPEYGKNETVGLGEVDLPTSGGGGSRAYTSGHRKDDGRDGARRGRGAEGTDPDGGRGRGTQDDRYRRGNERGRGGRREHGRSGDQGYDDYRGYGNSRSRRRGYDDRGRDRGGSSSSVLNSCRGAPREVFGQGTARGRKHFRRAPDRPPVARRGSFRLGCRNVPPPHDRGGEGRGTEPA